MKTKILELIDKKIEDRVYKRENFGASDEELGEEGILEELRQEIEAMREESQWIPVTESTENIKCIFTDGYEYGVGHRFRTDYSGISFVPTHFMPLPPHP